MKQIQKEEAWLLFAINEKFNWNSEIQQQIEDKAKVLSEQYGFPFKNTFWENYDGTFALTIVVTKKETEKIFHNQFFSFMKNFLYEINKKNTTGWGKNLIGLWIIKSN